MPEAGCLVNAQVKASQHAERMRKCTRERLRLSCAYAKQRNDSTPPRIMSGAGHGEGVILKSVRFLL